MNIDLAPYWEKNKVKAVYDEYWEDVESSLKQTMKQFIGMPVTRSTKQHMEMAINAAINQFIQNDWVRLEDR